MGRGVKRLLALAILCATATTAGAADPVYLDQLIESPLATLQQQFPTLKTEGCYALSAERYLTISIDRKDKKPWRVTISSEPPCRKPEDGPAIDVRSRSGVNVGDTTVAVVERLGRPDASASPDQKQKMLGDVEYFFICRVSEGCARHTSIFVKSGMVTAISEWYSE
jgi:hypothetical protein